MTDVDGTERLINAWLHGEDQPSSRIAAAAKADALTALGLHGSRAHEAIAAARRAGYDVPSACQAAVNDLAPTVDLEEAS